MSFPNAQKGVSKIFIAQILQLIGAIVSIISAVIMLAGAAAVYNAATEGAMAVLGVSAIVFIVSLIVAIVAFILNIVGLVQAQKDDQGFRMALVFSLICIVLSIVSTLLVTANPNVANWMQFVITIFELAVFEYVVVGIMSLAQKLGNQGMVSYGSKVRIIITILYFILLMIRLFGNMNADFGVIMGVISSILELVMYIAYIIYLGKAKKMLANG